MNKQAKCLCAAVLLLGVSVSAGQSTTTSALIDSPGNTTYYLDASTGSDTNPGTAQDRSWKTLDRANQEKLSPGD